MNSYVVRYIFVMKPGVFVETVKAWTASEAREMVLNAHAECWPPAVVVGMVEL